MRHVWHHASHWHFHTIPCRDKMPKSSSRHVLKDLSYIKSSLIPSNQPEFKVELTGNVSFPRPNTSTLISKTMIDSPWGRIPCENELVSRTAGKFQLHYLPIVRKSTIQNDSEIDCAHFDKSSEIWIKWVHFIQIKSGRNSNRFYHHFGFSSPMSNISLRIQTPTKGKEGRHIERVLSGFDYKNCKAWKCLREQFSTGIRHRELLSIASILTQLYGLPELNRDARRSFVVLIKWFDDRWPQIDTYLKHMCLLDENMMKIDHEREVRQLSSRRITPPWKESTSSDDGILDPPTPPSLWG